MLHVDVIQALSVGFTAFCVRENSPSSPVHSGFYIVRIHAVFAKLWYFSSNDHYEFSQLVGEFAVIW